MCACVREILFINAHKKGFILEQNTRRLLKNAFNNYKDNKQTAVQSIKDIAERGLISRYGAIAVASSKKVDGLESAIINYLDKQSKVYLWCLVVEKTLEHYYFDKEKYNFIIERLINKKTFLSISIDFFIAESTAKNWETEILELSEHWAYAYKLL